ncbi:Ig-like domain-containing protein [Paenibacillus methanolicus]|uniref:Ig-like protein group 2 n=1 Tax=Paenibacillus methanolicus TaxID=582686 RepID=A0A5S5CIP1_9BACL|nr:Ig-like domain-containing protein [Paenibacillus methanolicus]TYP79394.1 Ig-like protein group 2 [Paenibacillus methanolicus]
MTNRSVPARTGTSRLSRFALCLLLLLAAALPAAAGVRPEAAAAAGEGPYFVDSATWYRDYAPGTVSPNEGTVEMTVRFDKPYSEFDNDYDFMFRLIPGQSGPGYTLYSVYIPLPEQKPTGSTWEQPLTFFVRNGDVRTGFKEVRAIAPPSKLSYTVGQPFNLAFSWKLGSDPYVAIYMDGEEIARTETDNEIVPVMEKFVPYEFMVERAAPYNVSNLKISTRALKADELETSTDDFTSGRDTSLLADITLGQPVQTQKFVTPWHTESGYSVVKPAFRGDKQVFYRNEAAVFPVMTVNYGSAEKTYKVRIVARKPDGDTAFTESVDVAVPADGTHRVLELPLPKLNDKVGFWYLETTVESSPGNSVVYNNAVSKVPVHDAAVPDGKYADYFGIHVDYKDSMAPWAKINTDITRTWEDARVFMWYDIEPTNGDFRWDHSDQYVDAAVAAGLDVLGVLGNPSNWNSTRPSVSDFDDDSFKTPYQYQAGRYVSKDIRFPIDEENRGNEWAEYVYKTMKRYAGKVKYFEVWNEVNFHPPYSPAAFSGTSDEYFLMQEIAYAQAQRVKAETGQELYISTSGFSSVADRSMAVEAISKGNFDIYNIHGYQGIQFIQDDILPAYRAAKQSNPNLQLWQGEFGPINELYTTIPAKMYGTVQRYMDFLANGADKFFGFGSPNEDSFATRYSVSPTEVFQTTAMLQHHIRKADQYLGSYGFTGDGLLPVKHYLSRTDDKYLSILSSNQPLTISLGNADKVVTVEDNYGNLVPVQSGTVFKKNTLFIVSNEPLDISGVSGDVALTTIRNGGFENLNGDPMGGPSGVKIDDWTMVQGEYGKNAYVNKTGPYQGSNAVEFDSAGAPGNRTFMSQTLRVAEAGRYVLSASIKKLEGGADVQPELNIWAGNSDHQLAPVSLTGQYAYYAKPFQVTDTTKEITVNIGILSGVGKVVFDNVSFELVPVAIEMDNSDPVGVTFTNTTDSNKWNNTRENATANKGNFALNTSRDGQAAVTYTPSIPLPGMYEIYEWHHSTNNATTKAPFTVHHARGTSEIKVAQSSDLGGKWNSIGTYSFDAGSTGSVVISNGFESGTGNFILADGLKFVWRGSDIPVEIVMDNKDSSGVVFSDSTWRNTGVNTGAHKGDFALNTTKGGLSSATYTPAIPMNGMYEVYEWHHSTAGPTDAPFMIRHAAVTEPIKVDVDQSKNGGKWNKIGTYPFLAGTTGSVAIVNGNKTSNFILADGIKFVRVGPYVPAESVAVTAAGHTSPNKVLKGGRLALQAAVLPADATDRSVVWKVTNGTGAATIDPATGMLTGVEAGTVTVTAAVTDGSGVSGELLVHVVALESVTAAVDRAILKNGDQAVISVTGVMSDGTSADLSEAELVFASDSAAASVDDEGLVTATAAGEGTVRLTAAVTLGGTTVEAATEVLVDNTAPVLSVELSPALIWPPNHKMVRVQAEIEAEDAASGLASVLLTSITSNEPDAGEPDIEADIGTAATSFSVRAERLGSGSGRIYTVTYTATDFAGNQTAVVRTITIPHNK